MITLDIVKRFLAAHRKQTAALPARERRRRGLTDANYATGASSSRKLRVLFGSTGMPGAIVVVKVIFFR